MSALLHDFRVVLRGFSRSPGFAALAVSTLGIGIACATTVYSWVDSLAFHPFPGAGRAGDLVVLEMDTRDAPTGGTNISWPDYRDYREQMHALEGVAVYRQSAFTVGDGDAGRLVWGEMVSGNYFEVMGVAPLVGRVFTREEYGEALGAYPVAVISERLWRGAFGADPAIGGRTVRVNRQNLTIVGVVPEPFRGTSPVISFDLWVPVTMGPALGSLSSAAFVERGDRANLAAIGRLREGVTVEQARAEARTVAARLAAAYPASNRATSATVLRTWEAHSGVNDLLLAPLSILLAVSFVVLLLVCANVANLVLARAVARRREFGIRLALGAGRGRVAGLVLRETFLLAVGGAGAAMLLRMWTQGALMAMVPSIGFPLSSGQVWNVRIFVFTALACVTAAALAGVSPALLAFRSNLNEVLKDGGRGDTASGGSRRTRNLLAVAEVALATVALVGAGLFLQSFRNLRGMHPGFDAGKVLLGRFFLETAGYGRDQTQQFGESLRERLRGMPGVEAMSYTDFVPLSTTAGPYNRVRVDGYTPATEESMAVSRALVAPEYFATMGIPLVEGREFTRQDGAESGRVIIVNEAFARRYFAGRSALGRRVRAGGQDCTVVGVARDSKYFRPDEAPAPFFYRPMAQAYGGSPELYVLVRGQAEAGVLRQAVKDTDGGAVAFHAVGLDEYTELATIGQKVAATLMGGLGVLCLLLAGSGLYSVMSYTVSQRIPEIGIRMAMGAGPGDVIGMIVREGMGLVAAGVAVGTVLALAAARMVGSLLVGVAATDPLTFAGAAMFLGFMALVATWIPAHRATGADPMGALRK